MRPGTYKKIPRPVEAVEVRDLLNKPLNQWPLWAHALERRQLIGVDRAGLGVADLHLEIITIQRQQVFAGPDEWLLWDPESFEKRDVWPVQAEVFETTYERVDARELGRDEGADRFDRCEARSFNLLERCEHEAGHGGPHSFEPTVFPPNAAVEAAVDPKRRA